MRILVVDDDMTVLMESGWFLHNAGHAVCKAHGGKEALHTFEQRGPFDVVLTDYDMPDMNGVDLCFAIRKLTPTQRIVINTGSNTLESCMEDYGLADIPVLSKNLGIKAIMEKL